MAKVAEAPVKKSAKEEVSENLEYLEKVRVSGDPIQKIVLTSIEAFCETMKPRAPLSEEAAIAAERGLLDLVLLVLRKDYEEFRKGWSTLLVYFDAHHGDRPTANNYSALSEYSTSRYLDRWTDSERAEAYVNLVTLLRATRKLSTRKQDAKRVILDKIAPSILTERMLDNIKRFYS